MESATAGAWCCCSEYCCGFLQQNAAPRTVFRLCEDGEPTGLTKRVLSTWSGPDVKEAFETLQEGSRNFALWPKRPKGLCRQKLGALAKRPCRALRCWSDTQPGAVRIRRSLPQRAGTIKTARTLPGAAEGSQSPTTRRRRAARKHRACPTPHAVAALKHHGAAPRPADDDGRI